jgi:hypothetical protein
VTPSRVLDEALLVDGLALDGSFPVRDPGTALRFSSCTYESLPRWRVSAAIDGGSSIELDERFRPDPRATGPANVVRAVVDLAGRVQVVDDYFRLAHSAARHNELASYRVVLDPPLPHPVSGAAVHGIDLHAAVPRQELGARVVFLGAGLTPIGDVAVTGYSRRAIDAGVVAFRRGDADASGQLNTSDAVHLLLHLFREGDRPACLEAADADDSGALDITDAVAILRTITGGAGPLPEPFLQCGHDEEPSLGCGEFEPCAE